MICCWRCHASCLFFDCHACRHMPCQRRSCCLTFSCLPLLFITRCYMASALRWSRDTPCRLRRYFVAYATDCAALCQRHACRYLLMPRMPCRHSARASPCHADERAPPTPSRCASATLDIFFFIYFASHHDYAPAAIAAAAFATRHAQAGENADEVRAFISAICMLFDGAHAVQAR